LRGLKKEGKRTPEHQRTVYNRIGITSKGVSRPGKNWASPPKRTAERKWERFQYVGGTPKKTVKGKGVQERSGKTNTKPTTNNEKPASPPDEEKKEKNVKRGLEKKTGVESPSPAFVELSRETQIRVRRERRGKHASITADWGGLFLVKAKEERETQTNRGGRKKEREVNAGGLNATKKSAVDLGWAQEPISAVDKGGERENCEQLPPSQVGGEKTHTQSKVSSKGKQRKGVVRLKEKEGLSNPCGGENTLLRDGEKKRRHHVWSEQKSCWEGPRREQSVGSRGRSTQCTEQSGQN